jgi:hypothetical protein
MREALSRPEHDVLLCVARRALDAEQQATLHALLAQVHDWDYLFAAANTHGLIPLLQKHLHSLGTDSSPIEFRSRVRRGSLTNSQNMLHLAGKQLKLYRVLVDHDIPLAILKGSALAQSAYGDISLRQAGDIDVLISPAHFDRARLLLESLGYEMTPHLTARQISSHLATHCEIQFVGDAGLTVVDLHWALAPKNFVFNMETDELLSRLQPVTIAGTKIDTLATEDLIVYLSMHGAKHLWRAVEWISSLGELIRAARSIAWPAVIERAEKAHATRMLALGLRLAERVSGIHVPTVVFSTLDSDDCAQRLAHNTLSLLFDNSVYAESTETNLYNFKIMDRKRDAFVSGLRSIFVPALSDWQALNLPSSLHSLYYAYRPLRLSKAYSSALWRKLGSRGAACL